MARKKSSILTDAELRLMDVLWEKGAGTVSDVTDALTKSLPESPPLHYSTVLTTLRILEQKGYLKHAKDGRAFIYKPIVDKDQARDGAVNHLLRRFFGDSPELLVLSLVQKNKIDAAEFSRIQKRIAEAETKKEKNKP
jgi:predicted transcriptional regulator